MVGKTNVKVKPNEKNKIDYIEYIQSTGTQYIDTGLIMKKGNKIELDFSIISGTVLALGSTNVYNSTNNLGVELNKTYVWTRGTKYNVTLSNPSEYKFIATFGSSLKYQIGTWNITLSVSYNSLNYYLFACNENNVPSWNKGGEIYRCKIYDNDTLIRDFRPCKDESGVYCMYEEVEKKYYYNKGTGSFIGGASI